MPLPPSLQAAQGVHHLLNIQRCRRLEWRCRVLDLACAARCTALDTTLSSTSTSIRRRSQRCGVLSAAS